MKIEFYYKKNNEVIKGDTSEYYIDSEGDVTEITPEPYEPDHFSVRYDIGWRVIDS